MQNNNDIKETPFGKIKNAELVEQMEKSYLDYAMSVIVSRALPDVRDGLKPVHRRILFAMHELGLKSNVKFRKSATVVGEVLGKYHPHGDSAVYDAMARLAQDFSVRYLLVDGQGNFGSVDGDSPAAMRYTEARMKAISEDLLGDIEKDTVDFVENYDGTRKEPKVLPAKVPQLLLNGSLGIAVGMATNIAPHNLTEVCNAIIAVVEKPDINIDDLMKVITGPDFPTGGIAYNSNSIKEAYTTGKGAIVIRAVAEIIDNEKKNRQQIIVSEIPYQVNKSELIAKIADLVKTKKIEGISDIRDESDRNEGIRIVIDLKANAYASKILNTLYESTSLQTTFHMNIVALINGIQPRLINLKDILNEFIKHRQEIIKRRTKYDLDRAKEREHILQGLKIALDQIDKIISTIRGSETKEIAQKELVKNFKLTEIQAQAILEMRLSALAGLERKKIFEELEQIRKTIQELTGILESEEKILEIIKVEQKEMIAKYGDARRTKISNQQIGKFSAEDLIPNEEVIVALTKGGYIKRMTIDTFKAQKRGGKGIVGISLKDEDNILQLVYTYSHNNVYFFTNKGRVFVSKVHDIPEASRTAKGQAIVNIIQISPEEKITAILSPSIDKKSNNYIFMATKNGVIKKTDLEKYNNIRKTGIIAIGLKNNDLLRFVKMTSGEDNVLLVTVNGQGIYFHEDQLRPMGRSASGVRGIKIREGDEVCSMDIVKNENLKDANLLTVLEKGYGKRTIISKFFRIQNRGGVGVRVSKVNSKVGTIIKSLVTTKDTGDIVMISTKGTTIRTPINKIKRLGRDTMGVKLMRILSGESVSSVEYIPENEIEEAKKDLNIKESDNVETTQEIMSTKPIEKKKDKIISEKRTKEETIIKDTEKTDTIELDKNDKKAREILKNINSKDSFTTKEIEESQVNNDSSKPKVIDKTTKNTSTKDSTGFVTKEV